MHINSQEEKFSRSREICFCSQEYNLKDFKVPFLSTHHSTHAKFNLVKLLPSTSILSNILLPCGALRVSEALMLSQEAQTSYDVTCCYVTGTYDLSELHTAAT